VIGRYFQIKARGTSVRTEIVAGLVTFATMAYILAVNPMILSHAGMDYGAVFTATALASAIAIMVMAFSANLPFALAPGMGLNAFFAYTVVAGMGYSWQFALTAVFLEGIIFILLTVFNIRDLALKAIPLTMKHAISVGIGLFIALIGMTNAGLVVRGGEGAVLALGDIASPTVLVAIFGILFTGALMALKVKGAILVGIIASTLVGIPFHVTGLPENFRLFSLPPSLSPVFFQFEFAKILTTDMLIVLFTFLFVDMFDTLGTLVGVASKAEMLDEKGTFPKAKSALMADAIGTTAGAILGTSTVTTYVESAAGVAEGGKTGLTAFVVGILFLLALFISPVFAIIPAAATAPALIIVGLFMLTPVTRINWDDFTESIPAFLTMVMMPFAFSISDGIVFGLLSFVILKIFTARFDELSIPMLVVAGIFLLKFLI
jgi:adenine/guanine/hypoxanthine permease